VTNSGKALAITGSAMTVAHLNVFAGNISNTGALTAAGRAGLVAVNLDFTGGTFTFAGNIVNTAAISAAHTGIFVDNVGHRQDRGRQCRHLLRR
jgi:hypothetical protein